MISCFPTAVITVLISLMCLVAQCTAQADCLALANAGDCDYYQCLNDKMRCTSNDYPLNYGKKYCLRFADKSSCFTTAGQKWINDVRRCLMQSAVDSYNDSTTCEKLKEFAFDSHPPCYVDNGFCTDILLSFQNLRCLASEVFIFRDFKDKKALYQIITTFGLCGRNLISSFINLFRSSEVSTSDSRSNNFISAIYNYLNCPGSYDFVIILDSSGSIGPTNFQQMKNFIATMLSSFTIGPDDTRVGVIRYSDSSSIVIPLGSINTYSQLATAVRSIPYTGGYTYTNLALDQLTTAFATARVSEGIPRVVAVLTDGQSNDPLATVQAARAVHNAGINIFAFGIGTSISYKELNSIASGSENVIGVSSFSSSNFETALKQLQVSVCATSQPLEIGKALAIEIVLNAIPGGKVLAALRRFRYLFPSKRGLTLKLAVTQGNLAVHGSFSVQDPNELTSDFSIASNGNDIDYFVSPELYRQSTDNDNNDRRRTKRQASISTNATVYLSIVGLDNNNTFVLNTTFGDTTESISSSGTSVLGSIILMMVSLLCLILYI